MEEFEVEQVLILSTSHVPEPWCNDFEPFRYAEHEYGWLVFLYEVDDPDEITSWLRPIVTIALSRDCRYIDFDKDAFDSVLFETYEW